MYLLIFVSYDSACSFSKTRGVLSIPFLFLFDFLRILGKYISYSSISHTFSTFLLQFPLSCSNICDRMYNKLRKRTSKTKRDKASSGTGRVTETSCLSYRRL